MSAYRVLLRLLPRARRRGEHGEQMALVFADLRDEARRHSGVVGVGALWMKEAGGLVRFSVRDRAARLSAWLGGHRAAGGGPRRSTFTSELRWAWRSVRSRGASALLVVALLAIALASNAVVFSAADALVFHRLPYRQPDRLVEIQTKDASGRGDPFLSAGLLDEWRKHQQLFESVQGYLTKTIFLVGDGEPALVRTSDVTAGLFELLGASPRWGRSFVADDGRETGADVAIISESLARERYGDPARAVGRMLETTGVPLHIVGVMPGDFRFPDGSQRIWRALDPRGPLAQGFAGTNSIARLAPGVTLDDAAAAVSQRAPLVGTAAGRRGPYSATVAPLPIGRSAADQRKLFLVLVGAAICLLLTACANVASLELASAMNRARIYAIQLALGASRATLIRGALIEGCLLIGGATLLAAGLATLGTRLLAANLPADLTTRTVNVIDFDVRTFGFMAMVAALAWLLSTVPVVLFASRSTLIGVLKLEGRSASASKAGTMVRRVLTVVEISLALVLLVGGVLYARSYAALLAIDKGFDSAGVAVVDLTMPLESYPTGESRRLLAQDILARLRARPDVKAATWPYGGPTSLGYVTRGKVEVDSLPASDDEVFLGRVDVESDYFSTLRVPLRNGRVFEPGDPKSNVVVSEPFAKRFWPAGDAVGHVFRHGPDMKEWYQVVGVVGHVRNEADPPTGPSTGSYVIYVPRQPPPPPAPPRPGAPPRRNTGGSYAVLTFVVRLDPPTHVADVFGTIRAIDSRFRLNIDFMDDVYAQRFSDALLATRVIGGFGVLSFLVAIAGVYGVMAFLVAGRTREIGIRMALGARGADIRRLVLSSSLRLVGLGAALGTCGALVASRWVRSLLFGIAPTDPLTYALVAAAVVVTAALATWQPARQAARVDPAVTLRSE